jgi:predicted transport protein
LADKAIKLWSFPSVQVELKSLPFSETYTNNYIENIPVKNKNLFKTVSKRILNLDASVRQEIKKKYIAYKTTANFVDIAFQKSRLLLFLNINFQQIKDPKGLCRDVSNVGHWGNGNVEVGFSSLDQIDDVMFLVHQAFNKVQRGCG